MNHDHSLCQREHTRNWNLSRYGESLDVIETLVWMFNNGEATDVQALNSIAGVLETLQEPYEPIEFKDFAALMGSDAEEKLLQLSDEIIGTYAIKLQTGKTASEIAAELGLPEHVIWARLDAIDDVIHDH